MAKHDKESQQVSPGKGGLNHQRKEQTDRLDIVTWIKYLNIFTQTPVLDSIVKAWLVEGVSIVWISKVLVSLRDWTGPIPGFDYDIGQPSRATINRWNVWRQAGYERMLKRVMRRLKELEIPNQPRHRLPIGGRTLVGKMYFAPSRIHQMLAKFAHWAKTGWKPQLSLSKRWDQRDAAPYVHPDGFETQEEASFTQHIRTWDELLETPQVLRLFSAYEDQYRNAFQQALLDLKYFPSSKAPEDPGLRNFTGILARLKDQVPSYTTFHFRHALFPDGAATVFTSPIDQEWEEKRKWSPLEKIEIISRWKPNSFCCHNHGSSEHGDHLSPFGSA